ncbi:MAG: hypothetical protein IIA05_05930 [Proteobacteria bacterium]|nr:hypothetical protein [Pseudomonadota bacterium]
MQIIRKDGQLCNTHGEISCSRGIDDWENRSASLQKMAGKEPATIIIHKNPLETGIQPLLMVS